MVLPRPPVQNPFADPPPDKRCSSIKPIKHKPMNYSYSQNAVFETMKTRHRFRPFLGVRRESLLANLNIIWSGVGSLGLDVTTIAVWSRVTDKVEAVGTKIIKKRKYKGFPPNPRFTKLGRGLFGQRWWRHPCLVSGANFRREFCHARTLQWFYDFLFL